MSRESHDTLWLAGLCGARAGAAMMFMAYQAVLPIVQREWQLSGTAAGSISSHRPFCSSVLSLWRSSRP